MSRTFATATRRLVIGAGQLPPPMHGFSYVTSRVFGYLSEVGEFKAYDLAARPGARGLEKLISRLAATLRAAAGLIRYGRGAGRIAYVACDGGHGLIYMLALTLAARLAGCEIWLHHHSFAYIDRPRLLMRLIDRCGGARLRHIVLSGAMQRGFAARYGPSHPPVIVSNAAFVPLSAAPGAPPADPAIVVGCLSNLTREKGLYLFLALLDEAVAKGVDIRGRLAGPIAAPQDRQAVADAVGRLAPRLEYLGPLFGAERDRFYQSIDVFVLPTRYRNEAQPLVIFEAQAAGCLVMAYARGCIGDQLGDGDLALAIDDDFIGPAAERLEGLEIAIEAVRKARAARIADYGARHEAAKLSLEVLFAGQSTPRGPVEPTVRADIWHNVLWSRYKAVVFSETWRLGQHLNFDLRFFQIAETDGTRAALSPVDYAVHRYPFVLLFKSSFDEIAPIKLVARLLRHTMRTSSQIVCLVDHGHAAYWAQLLALKLRGKKVAVFCDATLNDHAEVAWKALCKRIFFRLLDGAFCYGARSTDYLIKYGMPAERIYVRRQAAALPPDYEAAQIPALRLLHAPDASAPSFLYVGRLAPEKDLETLIRALAHVRRRCPGARLVIAGGGPSAAQLQSLAAAEGVAAAVVFAGGLAGPALAELYLAATCLILPSSSEPWGLVVNEALHYGCPVLVSERCGCAPELVGDIAVGQIFRCGDVAELAEKLTDAIERYADRAATAKACLERIAPFHPTLVAGQLCAGLRQIGRKPRRRLLRLGGR